MQKILITGGAGYIGSHIALEAIDKQYRVAVLDNLSTGKRWLVPKACDFYEVDIDNNAAIDKILQTFKPDVVIHCAAFISVNESIKYPIKYYQNNFAKSTNFIKSCLDNNIQYFIFSSTAAVYKNNIQDSIDEQAPQQPISPYGHSKAMTEQLLKDIAKINNMKYGILRYFNVSGADFNLRSGQTGQDANHLIKVACETIVGKRDKMQIFGNDYNTQDGTCIRDFIHVTDLANAHLTVLDYFAQKNQSIILNCGNGVGYSVKEILASMERVSGKKLTLEYCDRRKGDMIKAIANINKINKVLNWQAQYTNIDDITKSSLNWMIHLQQKNNY